jgi:hypothetical protein
MTRFRRSMVGALITGLAHLITSLPAGAVWDHAHGDSANTGFARVDTAPASKPQQTVQVGTLAPVFVWSPQPRRISGGLLGTACDREVVHP